MGDLAGTIALLAVVALAEGVRRLPPDAFVLQRWASKQWHLTEPALLGRDFYVVAWAIPLSLPVVLRDRAADPFALSRLRTRLRARMRRARRDVAILRVVGALILAAVVIGVPLATWYWDVFGLVVAVELILLLCIVQATVTYWGLRTAGMPARAARSAALRLLSPFAAPRGAELVWDQVTAGVPSLAVAHELLGEDAFLAALRRNLYDATRAAGSPDRADLLVTLCGEGRVAEFFAKRPGGDAPFCPRCGSSYNAGVVVCADCEGVRLVQ